ncbi:MAG: isoprenylcysteine carboxylmethyltransferase family protein [Desulfuromonadaceae bacterium]|nr:isoprenylcysteine carboxylmethyltransferase family protein [Desulfuromonadaceae bacterium]
MSDAVQFLFRFTLFALVHSLFAVPSLKKRCGGQSTHVRRFYRLYYNIASLVLFGWTMAAFRNSEVLYVVPGVWSLVMYSMQILFLVILAICVCQTGIADFLGFSKNASEGVHSSTLVVSGCYRIVRHPLYLFSLLFLISNPVITVRWLLLTMVSAVYILVGARLEEKRLLVEYGDAYLTYQRAVPFLIPRIFTRKA